MAATSSNITNLADIMPLVYSFAASAGWSVSGSSSAPTLTHPTLVGAVPFTLSAPTTSTSNRLRWSDGTRVADLVSPNRGVSATPTILQPTKVWLFGGQTPEPYLHIAVEYGYNLYRHLYLGYAEKIGSFGGGEIICGSRYYNARVTGTLSYFSDYANYPFSANVNVTEGHGWMNIVHADNPNQWRKFDRPYPGTLDVPNDSVLGGFGDTINDIYLARGVSPYAGTNILIPVNLYAAQSGGYFVPVGRPAGVRMINITDLEPATTISDGVDTWRVFPVFRKTSSAGASHGSTSQWPLDDSSYFVGYAFRES